MAPGTADVAAVWGNVVEAHAVVVAHARVGQIHCDQVLLIATRQVTVRVRMGGRALTGGCCQSAVRAEWGAVRGRVDRRDGPRPGGRRVGWRGLTALVGGGLSEPLAGRGRYAGDAMMRA